MKLKILNPALFQGSMKKKRYFEGWYFKHVSDDLSNVYSFIPGISLTKDDPHAFIQVINGISGETQYITYPADEFKWKKDRLHLKIGLSVFTDEYIDLNIDDEQIKVSGRLTYKDIVRYPGKLLSPGIMGWYSFVPFMECKHGIVSVNHSITGELKINEAAVSFNGGKGYIEKDWGSSFPEAWIWLQSNNFNDSEASFTFSVAKIPWLGRYFIGFISFLYFDKRFYLFSTYNKSLISGILYDGTSLSFTLSNHDSKLKVTALKNRSGELRAPRSGKMSRRIKESIDSRIMISLFDNKGNLVYNDSSNRAGMEIIDEIFNYLDMKPQP